MELYDPRTASPQNAGLPGVVLAQQVCIHNRRLDKAKSPGSLETRGFESRACNPWPMTGAARWRQIGKLLKKPLGITAD